ncbi:sulfotransferase [Promineifilum sp.]|uniref:sulfotransferase n=1 Tax=Promineifilum sp. TaxID=2664178 RepID=UPI0035AF27B3
MKKLFGKLRGIAVPNGATAPTPPPPAPIVVVSGLPRSGTSMMMKMLEAGGIPPLTDKLRTADKDNPKGYYEFERVKQLDKGDTAWLPQAEGKVVKVISALLKHLPSDYRYQVIFQRRHMSEILASQRKMLVHRGEDPDKMDDAQVAALFERHVQQIEQWLGQQPNIEVLYTHYSDVMADPLAEIDRIGRFLGRDLDVRAMAEVVDPDLYRNRQVEEVSE